MDLAGLKTAIQQHMSDGLVTIIGSGLSCAEGLPSMAALAAQLEAVLGPLLSGSAATEWASLLPKIGSMGLEPALFSQPPSAELEDAMRKEVGRFIAERERSVVAEVFQGKRVLRFTKLLRHLLRPTTGVQVVTTNYDRLIEVAAEEAGLGVDTMFNGVFAARVNEREARLGFCRNVTLHKGAARYQYAERLVINKPHGSLDWYDRGGTPVRHCGELLEATMLIIPPGQSKYRNGYSSPFDLHRERGNKAIDRASRFLIIGYGFNDDHLETHLTQKIKSGVPTVLLTHSLSAKAKSVLNLSAHVFALEDATVGGVPATRVFSNGAIDVFNGITLWDLNNLVKEVFEP
jgi:hypothetical protein